MTSAELRKLATYEENSRHGGACSTIVEALNGAADELDRLDSALAQLRHSLNRMLIEFLPTTVGEKTVHDQSAAILEALED